MEIIINNLKKDNYRLLKITYFVSFLCLFIFVAWRARYGGCSADEGLYLNLPYRIYQGDAPFLMEWNSSEMSSILSYPLVFLYMSIVKTTDKIFLNFRIIFYIVWAALSFFLFYKLKRISVIGASICSLFIFPCSTLVIGFSYNTLGIAFLLLCCVLLTVDCDNKFAKVFAGMCFACAVLCHQSLVVLFVIYFIYSIFYTKERKIFPYFMIGISFIAIVYFTFVFSKISLKELIDTFIIIINNREEYTTSIINYRYIGELLYMSTFSFELFVIYSVLSIICIFDKKKYDHRNIYMISVIILSIMFLYSIFKIELSEDLIMFPISIIGPYCLLYKDETNRKIFKYIWIPGFLYSILKFAISTTVRFAICSALTISSLASILMLCVIVQKIYNNLLIEEFITFFFLILIVLQLSCEIALKYRNVYPNQTIREQCIEIDKGPQKGLVVNEDYYLEYSKILNDLSTIDTKNKNVLFLVESAPYLYFHNNGTMKNASYSSWIGLDSEIERRQFNQYYSINESKLPDIVYSSTKYIDLALDIAKRENLNVYYLDSGYILCH